MTHKIGDMIIPAISKFDISQKTTYNERRVLGLKYPISKKIGGNPKTASIESVFWGDKAEHLAEYLQGLADVDYPIYMDSDLFKGWLEIENADVQNEGNVLFTVSINAKLKSDSQYKAIVRSKKKYIKNAFVSENEIVPTIMLPAGTKVIYKGVSPKRDGLVDIYETDSVELAEGQQITNIKIYDDMGSTNEDDWVLVSKPEEHKFIGNCIIEYGNIRFKQEGYGRVYIWNGSEWVYQAFSFKIFNDKQDNRNFHFGKIISFVDNTLIVNHPTCIYAPPHYYDNGHKFDGNCVKYVDTYGCNIYKLVNSVVGNSTNVININSDLIVKTGGCETDYTLTNGSKGWVMEYNKDTEIALINFYDSANERYFSSNGWGGYGKSIATYFLVNYIGKLFNEAENGTLWSGASVVADDTASSGYVIQLNANMSAFQFSMHRDDLGTSIELPPGEYIVIWRVKANITSSNDIFKFRWYSDTLSRELFSIEKSSADIGTDWTYIISPKITYNNDRGWIGIHSGSDVDDSTIKVDYAIIVPVSEIENIQKRVFCNNNQTVQITPRY